MGNRAVITTEEREVGIYLHWDGDRDSVENFLAYCKMRDFRPLEQDSYGFARFCQVVGNYIGGGLSIGVDKYDRLDTDNFDNGVYITKNWEIVGREFFSGEEPEEVVSPAMLFSIDNAQPEKEKLGKETIEELYKKL